MAKTKFKVGDKVTHVKFGNGVVKHNDGTDFAPYAVQFE
jgi:hypothetical protein